MEVTEQQNTAALVPCTDCGAAISERAPTCPSCGCPRAVAPAARASTGGPIVALIGAGMLALSPFLPWATLGMISASGMQKTNNEAMLLVVAAVITAIVAIASLAQRRRFARWVSLVMGAGAGGLTWMYMTQIQEQMAGIRIGSPQLGDGVYVAFGGAALMVVAGVMSVEVKGASG